VLEHVSQHHDRGAGRVVETLGDRRAQARIARVRLADPPDRREREWERLAARRERVGGAKRFVERRDEQRASRETQGGERRGECAARAAQESISRAARVKLSASKPK
jgi:hypothetical protein